MPGGTEGLNISPSPQSICDCLVCCILHIIPCAVSPHLYHPPPCCLWLLPVYSSTRSPAQVQRIVIPEAPLRTCSIQLHYDYSLHFCPPSPLPPTTHTITTPIPAHSSFPKNEAHATRFIPFYQGHLDLGFFEGECFSSHKQQP